MTADVVIRAEGLGKKYVIGHQSTKRVPTLRDAIVRGVNGFARTTREILQGKPIIAGDEVEEFWALKNVSFEIRRGDVVGVIGRNGAGKSTLLKVLSRITEPTEGRVEIRGRVASLLEVGTGFHPELSGRENIYLNGAILGMTRAEIKQKFDEIVAFAEVEQFLDTPVKRYSSGMYVRLAFAVAAHLEPEILVVDEVLAVGDAEFQRKCIGKMQDVAGHGRTVLFVSHNLSTISTLCLRALHLSKGKLFFDGVTKDSIRSYLSSLNSASEQFSKAPFQNNGFDLVVNSICHSQDLSNKQTRIELNCDIESPKQFEGALLFFIRDELHRPVGAATIGGMGSLAPLSINERRNSLCLELTLPRLAQGNYSVDLEIADKYKNQLAFFDNMASFEAMPSIEAGAAEVLRQSWGFGSVWAEARKVD